MEAKFIKPLIALGVPGVALGIFFLLLNKFNFQFSQVSAPWTVAIVLLFLLIVGSVTLFALHRWSPDKEIKTAKDEKKSFEYVVEEERVTYIEKMASLPFDVVKVNAHSHYLGIAAEYAWIDHKYPKSERLMQRLTTLDLATKTGEYKSGQIHFDVIKFKLPDGRIKEIYFDISSFFDGKTSSLTAPDQFVSKKLMEIYQ